MVPGCGSQGPAIKPSRRLSADWLYTGTGEIISSGALIIQDGRIVATGPKAMLPVGEAGLAEHFPGGILVPGLVNAHTHLELTGLEGKANEQEFPDWIRTIIRLKSGLSPAQFLAAARDGLEQGFACGVTTVADTGDSGAAFDALLALNGSGIAYLEVFGPDPALAESQFTAFRDRVLQLIPRQTERVRLGLSPHAPYSVSGPLYRRIARLAEDLGLPLAVHIAESAAESELLARGDGPFARQWKERGIPLPPLPGRSPLTWLDEHEVLGPRTLCIHAVRALPDDIARLARRQCSVAHCPRSNRRHGHGDAPLASFLASAIPVGVGSDSAASLPVDLLAEARAARALAGLSAQQALDLVMLGSARALDLDQALGSLTTGKWADCAVIDAPRHLGPGDVAEAILASRPNQVVATFLAGREVYRRT